MPEPMNAEQLRALEAEARQCEQRQEYLEALDGYEEIERKGWARSGHLARKAFCLIKLRRKQDARKVLIHVFDSDPGCQEAISLLDEHFPGWEKTIQPASAPAAAPPRPAAPPAPAFHPAPPPRPAAEYAPQYAPPLQPSQAPPAPAYAPPPQAYAPQPQAYAPQPQAYAPPASQPAPPAQREGPVNWRWVMEDLKTAIEEMKVAGGGANRPGDSVVV